MKIYVVTHKPCELLLPQDYVVMQVGAALHAPFSALTDNTGDNISAKNPYYCELTAAYWIWKNDKENDVVGLMHYRRFLSKNRFSASKGRVLPARNAEKWLKKYDFIVPAPAWCPETQKESFLNCVREQDFDIMRSAIERLYPEYLSTFDRVFEGHESYLCNIFICKKQEWDNYHAWLFSVFDEIEKTVDMTGYSDQEKRLYGYLSERLLTVYIWKNNFRTKNVRVIYTENQPQNGRSGDGFFSKVKRKMTRIFHSGKQ